MADTQAIQAGRKQALQIPVASGPELLAAERTVVDLFLAVLSEDSTSSMVNCEVAKEVYVVLEVLRQQQ